MIYNDKIVIFLRKKVEGQNSIEELVNILFKNQNEFKIVELPFHGRTIKEIYQNIIFARKHSGEINHFFTSSESYIIPFVKGKTIITWHDLKTAFRTRNKFIRFIKKYFLRYFPNLFADKITCISEHTYKELNTEFPKLKNKTCIIHNPLNPKLNYSPKSKLHKPPVILHIGTAQRKNLERVIESLNGLDCKLVIVGKLTEEQYNLLVKNQINYENSYDIPFEEVIKYYKNADIISFPSLYEGFGMPIIEAQAIGRPVLTSKCGSIPEVAANSVLYVDPYNIQSIKIGFETLLVDNDLRRDIIKKGLDNIKRYNVDYILRKYKNLYDAL